MGPQQMHKDPSQLACHPHKETGKVSTCNIYRKNPNGLEVPPSACHATACAVQKHFDQTSGACKLEVEVPVRCSG
jgi:hypothetical protein